MTHASRFSLLVLFSLALFAAPLAASAATQSISIVDDSFNAKNITVYAGDTVTWQNNGSMQHTVTADNGSFDSGTIAPGQSFSASFNQPGTYSYYCKFHGGPGGQGMSGTVTVLPAASQTTAYTNPNTSYYTTTGSNSSSVGALQQQVQQLIDQINTMQGGSGAGGSAGSYGTASYDSCPSFTRALALGATGADVTQLQQYLARDPSIYPEGLVTGYFGSLTEAAVQRWQAAHNVVSSGDPSSTGYGVVGPRTSSAMEAACASAQGVQGTGGGSAGTGGTGGIGSGYGQGPVGGYVTISPVSGVAPLTVNVTAAVNTAGSCSGGIYTLNFGDGTAPLSIPVAAGNCLPLTQVFQHAYQSSGTYQLVLASGSHQTSATLTVQPPASQQNANRQPAGSISAFVQSGNAPLNVTFYVSCVAGSAYNVVFGDGSDLGSTGVGQSSCNGSLQAVSHTYQLAGNYTAQLILFVQQSNGTIGTTGMGTVGITVGNPANGYNYAPPQLTPGSAVHSFTVQFDLPSSCTGYDLDWGDSSAHATVADSSASCAYAPTTKSLTHTYSADGSFSITLKRGPGLSNTQTVAVTVSS